MATYNVGGLSIFNRVKTIDEALSKALDGDDVNIGKAEKHESSHSISSGIHMYGNNYKMKIKEHKVGFVLNGNGHLTLENLNIEVNSLANAIAISNWVGKLTLIGCRIYYKKRIRKDKTYPLIGGQDTNNLSLEIIDSEIDSIHLECKSISIRGSKINGVYFDSILNSEELIVDKSSSLKNTKLISNKIEMTNTLLSEKISIHATEGELKEVTVGSESETILDLIGNINLNNIQFYGEVKTIKFSDGIFELRNIKFPKCKIISNSVDLIMKEDVEDNAEWEKNDTTISNQTEKELAHKTEDSAMDGLMKLVGIDEVKNVMIEYRASARVAKARELKGLDVGAFSLHLVFSGSPGTGKTTVAEFFGKALYEEGILPTSKVKKVSREDLIDNIIGGTAIKTRNVIDEALGGVLFIDEAYSLRSQGERDFANEAVDTLVNAMDAHRDELVVILAGYSNEMKDFFNNGNPGLKSRFNNWIEFPDYTFEELWKIMELNLSKQFTLNQEIKDKANLSLFKFFNKGLIEGNARFIRNFVEKITFAQSQRISTNNNFTTEALQELKVEDIELGYNKFLDQLMSKKY